MLLLSEPLIIQTARPTRQATRYHPQRATAIPLSPPGTTRVCRLSGFNILSESQQPLVTHPANSFSKAGSTAKMNRNRLHGSGTPIGDALELEAVKLFLDQIGHPFEECIVGSNKGTLGNTQHASGLVSLVKICKSIQAGTIPAMARTGKLHSFITDANLPVNFAYQPTKVKSGALISISAAGWGGVNSHVVVQVPPAKLLKKMGKKQSKYHLCNKTLAAPRKSGLGVAASHLTNGVDPTLDLMIPEINNVLSNADINETRIHLEDAPRDSELVGTAPLSPNGADSTLDLITQEVIKILGNEHPIAADTDLRAAGLDSAKFVRLAHSIRRLGEGFYLP